MITFITGLMKSGKSAELIDRIEKEERRYLIIKPGVDTRDGEYVRTRKHNRSYMAICVNDKAINEVRLLLRTMVTFDLLFIDEVQFFSEKFMKVLIQECKKNNIDIVASGLSKDFRGQFFPVTELLLDSAQSVQHKQSKCDHCSEEAHHDIRLDHNGKLSLHGNSIGAEGLYQYRTVCNECYQKVRKG